MKRVLALMLSAVLLMGCLAACGKEKAPEVSQNVYATEADNSNETQDARNIPDGYIRFGTIDEDDIVTVEGEKYLLSSVQETVLVNEKSKVTANISDLDGTATVASVTVDGKSISVYVDESEDERVLYAPAGTAGTDDSTVNMTAAGNNASAGSSKTNSSKNNSAVTTTKKAGGALSTAAPIKTTAKHTGTTDAYQKAKDEIMSNTNLSAREKQEALKLLGYKIDSNGIFYVEHEPWQKQFGFNQIYDLASPLIQLVYGTIRVKFRYGYVYKLHADGANKGKVMYDENEQPIYETDANGQPIPKDWMIQLWKGRYGLVMLGGEIGIYTKPSTQTQEHYYSAVAEEELVMAMDVYQHNFKSNTKKYLFTRGPESNWWLTGFVPGSFHEYNKKSEIIMVSNIEFPTEEMMQLFAKGMKSAGFEEGSPGRDNPETYRTSGKSIKFSWQYVDQK